MAIDYVIDFETLGKDADCVVVNFSIIGFDPSRDDYTFEELVSMARTWKFNLDTQVKAGRTIDSDTLEWWLSQSENARSQLETSEFDVDLETFVIQLKEYLDSHDRTYTTLLYARGIDFDLPILKDIIGKYSNFNKHDFITKFWNARDIRSIIAGRLDNNLKTSFLSEKDIPGFIKHNSTHDVAKAVYELQESRNFINS